MDAFLGQQRQHEIAEVMADRLGLSGRQLHRRCLPVSGYGPRRLARVLRLGRALERAAVGAPLAGTAPTGWLRELDN